MGETRRRYRSLVMDSDRWEGFEFRPDDIVISTPSKCGTTWTQMICALLIFQDPQLPGPLTDLSPWLDVQTRSRDQVFAELAAQTHRRFIKTHTPYDGIPHDDRVTYITAGRDPRDVALSWDDHMANLNIENFINARAAAVGLDDLAELMPDGLPVPAADPIARFWEWIDSEAFDVTGMAELLHHLRGFWDRRNEPNIILLHYADLTADLEGEMRRVAGRLGIDVPEDKWPALVDAACFEQMKGRAEQLAPQVTDKFWNASGDFFKSGSSGKWQAFFTDADHERYEARLAHIDDPAFVDWLHHGSRFTPSQPELAGRA